MLSLLLHFFRSSIFDLYIETIKVVKRCSRLTPTWSGFPTYGFALGLKQMRLLASSKGQKNDISEDTQEEG